MSLILEVSEVESLVHGGYQGDPFAVLGMHTGEDQEGRKALYIRTIQPQAQTVEVIRRDNRQSLGQMCGCTRTGCFSWI